MAQVFHKKEMPFAYGKYREDANKVKDGKKKDKRIQTVLEVLGTDFEYIKIAERQKEIEFRGTALEAFKARKTVLARLKAAGKLKPKKEVESPVIDPVDPDAGTEDPDAGTGAVEKTPEQLQEIEDFKTAYLTAKGEKETADIDVTDSESIVNARKEDVDTATTALEVFGDVSEIEENNLPEGYAEAKTALDNAIGDHNAVVGTHKAFVKIAEDKTEAETIAKNTFVEAGGVLDVEEETED